MIGYIGDFLVEDGVVKRYIGVGGELVIPEEVKEIGDSAFINCAAVTSAELPEGIEVIRCAAFSWRTGLLKVKLPHSLRVIEEGAFEGCGSLVDVNIPEGVREIHVAAFHGCQALESIRIPTSLEIYEDFIEENCSTAILAPGRVLADILDMYKIHAAHGFALMSIKGEEISESLRREYMEFIMLHEEKFSKRALKSKPLLQFMMAEELLDADRFEQMLSHAIEEKDFELTASLLDYQGRLLTTEKRQQRLQQQEDELGELWEF